MKKDRLHALAAGLEIESQVFSFSTRGVPEARCRARRTRAGSWPFRRARAFPGSRAGEKSISRKSEFRIEPELGVRISSFTISRAQDSNAARKSSKRSSCTVTPAAIS